MADPERTREILQILARRRDSRSRSTTSAPGYSSLARLKHLPIDILKIDRSFVSDAHVDRDAGTMVQAMVQLAKNLGMKPARRGGRDDRGAGVPPGPRLPHRTGVPVLATGARRRAHGAADQGLHADPPARTDPSAEGRPSPGISNGANRAFVTMHGPCAGTTPPRSSRSGSGYGRRRASIEPPTTPTTRGRASTRSTCSRTPRATCTWATPRRSPAATPSRGSGRCRATTSCTRSDGTRSA